MSFDAGRVIADLRELDRLTGGPEGARRVCWTGEWQKARGFLRAKLAEIDGLNVEQDEAGNLWATLPAEGDAAGGTLAVGSHIDSVPNGGWLDGALGVMAALEVLRAAAGERDRRAVALVDFADEEGARFGRSLFGSSAVAGTLDPGAVADLRDGEGRTAREVLAEHGVDVDRAPRAASRRDGLAAYLELHIEQGPVLEAEGVSVAAVSGTFGVERVRLDFTGQASHAGTTPMDMRDDAGLAAARTALAVEQIARRHGGVGTTGTISFEPGIPTAVPGRASLTVDLRHAEAEPLAAMLAETRATAGDAQETTIWRIEPIAFDPELVELAREQAGSGRVIASGALHDAAEMARHVPVAMLFAPSSRGISHAKEEDTPEGELREAIDAFGRLALRLARAVD